jgi:hypothetical protein
VLFVVFSVFLPGWRSDVMGHSRLRWSRPSSYMSASTPNVLRNSAAFCGCTKFEDC